MAWVTSCICTEESFETEAWNGSEASQQPAVADRLLQTTHFRPCKLFPIFKRPFRGEGKRILLSPGPEPAS